MPKKMPMKMGKMPMKGMMKQKPGKFTPKLFPPKKGKK